MSTAELQVGYTDDAVTIRLPRMRALLNPLPQFDMGLCAVKVQTVNMEDSFCFELTLNTKNLLACRTELLKVLPSDVVDRILDHRKDRLVTISARLALKASKILKRRAEDELPKATSHLADDSPMISSATLGNTVTGMQKGYRALASLAGPDGKISRHRFPRPSA